MKLKVSDNRRYLVHEDGTPFFYLGDTAWELFHRADYETANTYLRNRAMNRFTVIQAVILAEEDGIHTPNSEGELPLVDADPTRPNEKYFQHVDRIVDMAASYGLHIGMLPTWGDKWNKQWGQGPVIFTPENARIYGQFLGKRYKTKPIIWILGGDRHVETEAHRSIIENMALGLREGDEGEHLIAFHPMGGNTSASFFHTSDWLAFNMWQSGHGRNTENYNCIAQDYARTPTKPCMDAEAAYEDHPAGFNLDNGYIDDYEVRKGVYWALFAGAHGHTYGCHPIWQFWQPGRKAVNNVRHHWRDALLLPGAAQMQHARALIESRPFLTRVPDQSLIASELLKGTHHLQATRDEEGSYAFVFFPSNKEAEIHLDKLKADHLRGWWYDTRTGTSEQIGEFTATETRKFTPPQVGPDWVLVLDDVKRGYARPGSTTK